MMGQIGTACPQSGAASAASPRAIGTNLMLLFVDLVLKRQFSPIYRRKEIGVRENVKRDNQRPDREHLP